MADYETTTGNDFVHYEGDGLEVPDGYNEVVLEPVMPQNVILRGGTDILNLGHLGGYIYAHGFLDADDTLIGGNQGLWVYLEGDYSTVPLVLGNHHVTGVRWFDLAAGFSYTITVDDTVAAAGQYMVYDGSKLGAGDTFSFDGTAETDGGYSVYGGDGHDTIRGAGTNSLFNGWGGDDILTSSATVQASINGGSGNDTITYSSPGVSWIFAGAGNDVVTASGQVRAFFGENGNDVFTLTDATLRADAFITGDSGFDTFRIAGHVVLEKNLVLSTSQFERFWAASGFIITAGAGVDLIDLTASVVTGSAGVTVQGGGGRDSLTGSGAGDSLYGGDFSDIIGGGGGADLIDGGTSNDSLFGGTGNDTLNGGSGNDILYGEAGNDSLIGGTGADTYIDPSADTIVEIAGGGVDLVMSSANASLATLVYVENLILTATADINGIGNSTSNAITGNSGANILTGNSGYDTLTGGGGNDTLSGGNHADLLIGGEGNDQLDGGSFADIFAFATSNTGDDRVVAFQTIDRFDLSGGQFTAVSDGVDGATLTHAGGTLLMLGITGRSLDDWNGYVV